MITKKSDCTNDKCSLFGKCSLGANCQFYKGEGKGNKYHAQKCEYDGMVFDSNAELNRYLELRLMERGGLISNLQRQVTYELIPNQKDDSGKVVEKAVKYRADFVYTKDGKQVCEDVKGCKRGAAYQLFVLKRKLMRYVHNIEVIEV